MHSGSPVAVVQGLVWCVSVSSTSLMSLRRLNNIIVTSRHMFTLVG